MSVCGEKNEVLSQLYIHTHTHDDRWSQQVVEWIVDVNIHRDYLQCESQQMEIYRRQKK